MAATRKQGRKMGRMRRMNLMPDVVDPVVPWNVAVIEDEEGEEGEVRNETEGKKVL